MISRETSNAFLNAVLHYLGYQERQDPSVMMPPMLIDSKDVADWYRQLWAESLGKEVDREGNLVNVGPTPIKALGATDPAFRAAIVHGRPLYKIITFLEVEDYGVEVEIPELYEDIQGGCLSGRAYPE